MKGWKRIQSRIYILVIIANALIFLDSLVMYMPYDKLVAHVEAVSLLVKE